MKQLAAWLAEDPNHPVYAIGVLIILATLCYGLAAEMRGGRR